MYLCECINICVGILNMKLGEKRDEGVWKAREERKEVEYVFTSIHIHICVCVFSNNN